MKKQIRVSYSKNFIKQLKKAPIEIKRAFLRRENLFNENPYHAQLRGHALSGKYKGLRSINITGDWRVLYIEQQDAEGLILTFKAIGTHSQLYG